MRVHVHARMQNAYYVDNPIVVPIINTVPVDGDFTIACTNMAAVYPQHGIGTKGKQRSLDLIEVGVGLRLAPGLLGIKPDFDEIGFRSGPPVKLTHGETPFVPFPLSRPSKER